MFRKIAFLAGLCAAGVSLAQTTNPAVRTGKIEIDGKPYRYTLLAETDAPAPEVPNPKPVEPAKPSPVVILAGQGPAPAAVHVHGLEATLAAGSPLTARYEWDFGDPGSRFNTLAGWNAAHLYQSPGGYVIRLKITDQAGNVQAFSNKLTIAPSTRRKVYVSEIDGNDADNGADDRHACQTLERGLSFVKDDCELLLDRGGKYELSRQANLPFKNIHIGTWGSKTERPKVRWTGNRNAMFFFSFDPARSADVVIEGLSFDTPFSSDTEESGMIGGIKPAGKNLAVRDCEFLNVGSAISTLAKPQGMLIQDNSAPLATGLRAYFVWVESSDFTIIGNQVANSTREHVIRSSSDASKRILIAHNDFTNLDRMGNDKGDQSKTTINFRAGSYVYIDDNTLKDGVVGFGPSILMKDESAAEWIVLDGNRISNGALKLSPGTAHVMVRNNWFDLVDTEQISIVPKSVALEGRTIGDITVAQNTGVNSGTKGKFLKVYTAAPAGAITLANNVYVSPQLKLGKDWACGVAVHSADTTGFAQISGNIWPTGDGPVQFVGAQLTGQGYLTAEKWNALPQVKSDRFENLSLESNGQVPAGYKVLPVPGARYDPAGKLRTAENCVPGAVQP